LPGPTHPAFDPGRPTASLIVRRVSLRHSATRSRPQAHHKHSTPTYVIPVILTGNHRLIVCAHKVCVAAFFSSPLQHTPPFLPPCRLRRRVPPRPSRGRRRGPRTPRASPSRCAPTSSAPSAASRPGPRRKGFCLCWSFFTYFYRLLFFKLGLDPVPFAA